MRRVVEAVIDVPPTPDPEPPSGDTIRIEAEEAAGQANFAPFQARSDSEAKAGAYLVQPNGVGGRGSATYDFQVDNNTTRRHLAAHAGSLRQRQLLSADANRIE